MAEVPDFGRCLGYDGKELPSHSTGRILAANGRRRLPESAGRWSSNWRFIQTGRFEEQRKPDMRRCE